MVGCRLDIPLHWELIMLRKTRKNFKMLINLFVHLEEAQKTVPTFSCFLTPGTACWLDPGR